MFKKVTLIGIILVTTLIMSFSVSASEKSARKLLKKNTTETIRKFYYTNLDGKKGKEAVAITSKKADEYGYLDGTVWYIKGNTCKKLYNTYVYIYHANLYKAKGGYIFAIEEGAGGSFSSSSVFYFKNSRAHSLLNVGSGINKIGKNQFTMEDSTFDISYENGSYIGHSFKPHYFKWTGSKFVEYGGIAISKSQFKQLKNGKSMLKKLKKQGKIYNIIYRSNGLINVNYRSYSSSSSWTNYNITLKVKNKKAKLYKMNSYGKNKWERARDDGMYKTYISDDVMFPKAFLK